MAKFTIGEADASTITKAEKVSKDGVHQCWLFGIIDTNGHNCVWIDTDLADDANDAAQKSAIHTYLTTVCEKKTPQPVIANVSNGSIINTTVG